MFHLLHGSAKIFCPVWADANSREEYGEKEGTAVRLLNYLNVSPSLVLVLVNRAFGQARAAPSGCAPTVTGAHVNATLPRKS
jgi:hypothetical protein